MKILSVAFVLFTFNAVAAPCGGAEVGFWTNPDGSRGGSVGKDAKVQAGVVIAPGAEVCDHAQVKSGAQILGQARIGGRAVISAGSVIEGRAKVQGEAKVGGGGATTKVGGDATVEGSASITGSSNVFARAKVGGGAKVHNSVICQASVIEGITVTDSDYYCQTEDPEPPHPGEAGKATLLGVDVDRDGVRDDVEIYINDKFSNTPTKDFFNERMAFKQFAAAQQKMLKGKNKGEEVRAAEAEGFDAISCLKNKGSKAKSLNEIKDFAGARKAIREVSDLRKDIELQLYNTKQRFEEQVEAGKHWHGRPLLPAGKTANGCYFTYKK